MFGFEKNPYFLFAPSAVSMQNLRLYGECSDFIFIFIFILISHASHKLLFSDKKMKCLWVIRGSYMSLE